MVVLLRRILRFILQKIDGGSEDLRTGGMPRGNGGIPWLSVYFSLVAISIVTLGVLCNLVVGPLMLAAKAVNTKRVKIHQLSTGLIALGLIGAAFFVIMKI